MTDASVAGSLLLVRNLEQSAAFYSRLGFQFTKKVPGIAVTGYLGAFWIELLLVDQVVTPEFTGDAAVSPKGAGAYLHVRTNDVDATYTELMAAGITANPPQDFPWGHREFVVTDPDGYKVVLFSPINGTR